MSESEGSTTAANLNEQVKDATELKQPVLNESEDAVKSQVAENGDVTTNGNSSEPHDDIADKPSAPVETETAPVPPSLPSDDDPAKGKTETANSVDATPVMDAASKPEDPPAQPDLADPIAASNSSAAENGEDEEMKIDEPEEKEEDKEEKQDSIKEDVEAMDTTDSAKEEPQVTTEKPAPKKSPTKSSAKTKSTKSEKSSPSKSAAPKKDDTPATKPKESKTPRRQKAAEQPPAPEPVNEDPKTPLLEAPLQVTGKRQRKQVERIQVAVASPAKEWEPLDGRGVRLGDLEYFLAYISSHSLPQLEPLYCACYTKAKCKSTQLRMRLREFRGWDFDEESAKFEGKKKTLIKMKQTDLKMVCELLGLEKKGTHKEIVDKICEYLLRPIDLEKPIPKAKGKKRKSDADAKSDSDSDNDSASGSESGASDAEEEPASKKSKKDDDETPSNDDIEKTIDGILEDADLEQTTMKIVCRQVEEAYPDVDLTPRKDFIKSTVKSIIAKKSRETS